MKSFEHITFAVITFFLTICGISTAVIAQKNLDVCRVTTHTRSIKEGRGTGIYEVGKFPVDDIDDVTTKSFRYERDGLVYLIDVAVEYGDFADAQKGKPTNINLSLIVKLVNDRSSASMVMPIEAGSKYRHKWGTLYVMGDILTGDIAQNFKLTCSDGISKDGVQRGEPKGLNKKGN